MQRQERRAGGGRERLPKGWSYLPFFVVSFSSLAVMGRRDVFCVHFVISWTQNSRRWWNFETTITFRKVPNLSPFFGVTIILIIISFATNNLSGNSYRSCIVMLWGYTAAILFIYMHVYCPECPWLLVVTKKSDRNSELLLKRTYMYVLPSRFCLHLRPTIR